MFKYYRTSLDKNQMRDLNIIKQELMTFFIDPRTGLQPPVIKKCICVDWWTYQPFTENWIDRWSMVFEKHAFLFSMASSNIMLLCFYRLRYHTVMNHVHLGWKNHPLHRYHVSS
jgi:hypothetical protein